MIYETIASGGRYDNLVANYQIFTNRKTPIAVGARFFCSKIINKILQNEAQRNDNSTFSQTDVYVVSIGDMTQEKMELLNELWKNGIRAQANYGNDVATNDMQDHCTANNIRFLVTFKKGVYSTS